MTPGRVFSRPAVGQRLRAAREARGLSQRQVARDVGVLPYNISGWERGLHLPRAEPLAYLALTLGVSADWILFGVEVGG